MLRSLLESPEQAIETALPGNWQSVVDGEIAALCTRLDALALQTSAEADLDPGLDQEVLGQMFDAGLFSLTVPRDANGLAASIRDFVVTMESVGRMGPAYAMTAVPHLCISVKAVASLCEPARAQAILSDIARRQCLLAFAITEDNGSDVAAVKTRVTRAPDGGLRLNGRKQWITNLARASHVVVVALCPDLHRAPGATVLLLVSLRQAGVEVARPWHKSCANGSDTADLYFDDVLIEEHQLLGQPGQGLSLFNDMVLIGRLGAAAAAVGMLRQALDISCVGSDGPLAPEPRAAIGAALQTMSATLALSAALGDAEHPEFPMVTALAKHFCSREAQRLVCEIERAHLFAGLIPPPHVRRATQAMGLFRLLKGPGEIISLHALAVWAPRIKAMPLNGNWPRTIKIGLGRVVAGFVRLCDAGGLSANPVDTMALLDATAAWWALFAVVMARRTGGRVPDLDWRRTINWAWRSFATAARRLDARERNMDIEQIDALYSALRHSGFA